VKELIKDIYNKSKGTYGTERITLAINLLGYKINIKRVHRLKKELKLKAVIRKKYQTRRFVKQVVAENILNRTFESLEPRSKFVTDVTELKRIDDKRYFLHSILDLCGNVVEVYSVSTHNDTDLALESLQKLKKVKKGALLHSDQGSPFTSSKYEQAAKKKNLTLSMSRVGNCYDNAAKESFFGHLKEEFYIFHNPKTEAELIENLAAFIKYYNEERLQVRLGGTPQNYRNSLSLSSAS
jgi:transposase InsO family protein